MHDLTEFAKHSLLQNWDLFFQIITIIVVLVLLAILIYDRFVQRDNQLLINFPLVGRMRYFFHLLRDPMRQYFGDETYYDAYEKIDWVNKASHKKALMYSFSMEKPYNDKGLLFRHANLVLNPEELTETMSVTFGERHKYPFVTSSVIGRSAMSDGAISPEGTQAFAQGALYANFPINTGEGGLTSNFLKTHKYPLDGSNNAYLEKKEGTWFAKGVYRFMCFVSNKAIATNVYREMVVRNKEKETYILDADSKIFHRIDWTQDLDKFPKEPLTDIPNITFQMGSGMYGVKGLDGKFDEVRYQKVMRFCKMTEIKMAQGAKQTGGKLLAEKVTDAIAYYRGVEANKALYSPNRFPHASSIAELFDFMGRLQELSEKPVGAKIVISTDENFKAYAEELKVRIDEGRPYPDFLTIDGGDGGSATAPREMMTRVGLPIRMALRIVVDELNVLGIRDKIKIIASEKILTPDDAIELFAYDADFLNIARGFMVSAGCIRARQCSGAGGHACPVGLATMDKGRRSKFLVAKKSQTVANYHDALIEGIRSLLAIMGKKRLKDLSLDDLLRG
ncbi:MAG: Ferredoxin-dependent glutamate synthase (EC [uncultured Sulfurovum sp.]|uniref:Ferredoxin-dependent glutamate synthase (EC) n=1 Tax=uncultured Sulfurovum sp. TaxID=269237 RepID=A0A6S6S0Z1_9BACT|nr:MAG: Ferredoxin-dependent glutamate synthase (EC [uncultured Sulfurovum sp.]